MGGLYYLDRNLDRKYGISDPRSIISSNYGLDKWIGCRGQFDRWGVDEKVEERVWKDEPLVQLRFFNRQSKGFYEFADITL